MTLITINRLKVLCLVPRRVTVTRKCSSGNNGSSTSTSGISNISSTSNSSGISTTSSSSHSNSDGSTGSRVVDEVVLGLEDRH